MIKFFKKKRSSIINLLKLIIDERRCSYLTKIFLQDSVASLQTDLYIDFIFVDKMFICVFTLLSLKQIQCQDL